MHFLYILYSINLNRYYVGESKTPYCRLKLHNTHHFKKSFTNATNDWKLALLYEVDDKKAALYLETFIKKMKSRKFIERIIRNTSILKDILSKR